VALRQPVEATDDSRKATSGVTTNVRTATANDGSSLNSLPTGPMSEPGSSSSVIDVSFSVCGVTSAVSWFWRPLRSQPRLTAWNGAVNGDTARTRSPLAHHFINVPFTERIRAVYTAEVHRRVCWQDRSGRRVERVENGGQKAGRYAAPTSLMALISCSGRQGFDRNTSHPAAYTRCRSGSKEQALSTTMGVRFLASACRRRLTRSTPSNEPDTRIRHDARRVGRQHRKPPRPQAFRIHLTVIRIGLHQEHGAASSVSAWGNGRHGALQTKDTTDEFIEIYC
jgi:hypothetical protein